MTSAEQKLKGWHLSTQSLKLMEEAEPRKVRILHMRQVEGMTFRKIGALEKVSASRAKQLYMRACYQCRKGLMTVPEWFKPGDLH